MRFNNRLQQLFRSEVWWVWCIAGLKLILNVAFHGRYGYFRDELYYIACSDHLAWGYVDQPPLCALILAATRWLFGDSLYAIRFVPALAGAGVVVLAGSMTRLLGGKKFAQLLAAAAAALSPVILGNAARYYSMNAFDLFFWALLAWIVTKIIVQERPDWWIWFGVAAGLGLLNKYSVGFLVAGLGAGLLLTAQRRHLLDRRFWLGALIASLLFLPHILWQVNNDFPSLEFMRRAAGEKNVALAPLEFLIGQFMQSGFAQSLLWLLGLAFFGFHPSARKVRLFAWAFVLILAVMLLTHAKVYYLTPVYMPYIAAGAVLMERVRWQGVRPIFTIALVLLSALVMPFALPVLPVDKFVAYQNALGITPKAEEHSPLEELPQYYADMFGWEEMVGQVAAIYRQLTPEEQTGCVIYVRNYGQAAAIDFFGRRYGLPPALCPHNNYWLWGRSRLNQPMTVAIIMGAHRTTEENLADLQGPGRFTQVELAATTHHSYAMPHENGRQFFICRGPQFSLAQIWPGEKEFI
ncbi:MAG TPA: glycosyltransferase family 39 protein [bacterium]|nr:glycosyltransferase family 39 protein [bacterium]